MRTDIQARPAPRRNRDRATGGDSAAGNSFCLYRLFAGNRQPATGKNTLAPDVFPRFPARPRQAGGASPASVRSAVSSG